LLPKGPSIVRTKTSFKARFLFFKRGLNKENKNGLFIKEALRVLDRRRGI